MQRNRLVEHLQAVALLLQSIGDCILECETQLLDLLPADGHHLRSNERETLTEFVDPYELPGIVINNHLSYGSRRLERGVHNQINDADIARMANAR